MRFEDIVGQSAVTQSLKNQVRSGLIVHACLLVGERGVGKRTLSQICAQALVCTGADKPCGVCGPCVRAQTGNHPDITVVNPGYYAAQNGGKAAKSIGVDDVRQLENFLSRKPFEADRNIALIPRAGLMTPFSDSVPFSGIAVMISV